MNIVEFKSKLSQISYDQNGHDFWRRARENLKDWLLWNNPNKFRDCPMIQQTMDVGQAEYIWEELKILKESPQWSRYEVLIDWVDGVPQGNSVHHAFHLAEFEKRSKRKIDEFDTIVEYGGGFGQTCKMVYDLGFKGEYRIVDFPELSLLQEFYLGEEISEKVKWNEDFPCSADLFIAEWSLSETEEDDRERYLRVGAKNYLMAYSVEFENQHNVGYFNKFVQNQSCSWEQYYIEHLDNKHAYLIGVEH